MSWEQHLPDGLFDAGTTEDGFSAKVSLPVDGRGFFGRSCPACETPFKMRQDEYDALPEELTLTCPYCGERADHSEFMTPEQKARAEAAIEALAEQFLHDQVEDMLQNAFGSHTRLSRSSSAGVQITYTPGTRPPMRVLPEVIEERVVRVMECSGCGNHHAVYGATAFCPVCGPRAATETVVEEITAARASLAIQDALPAEQREQLEATGVLERLAGDALKSVVSLFEVSARDRFESHVPGADEILLGKGNVFQRLDQTAELFDEHLGVDLKALVGADRWARLRSAFARRHVLAHRNGVVDQRFLDQVPDSGLRVGQRLRVTRQQAEQALDDLEAAVRALAVPSS